MASSVKSGAAAMPTSPAIRAGIQPARISAIQPPMLEPTRTCGLSVSRSTASRASCAQSPMPRVREIAGRRAVAAVVEPQVGLPRARAQASRKCALVPVRSERKPPRNTRPGPCLRGAAKGEAAAVGRSSAPWSMCVHSNLLPHGATRLAGAVRLGRRPPTPSRPGQHRVDEGPSSGRLRQTLEAAPPSKARGRADCLENAVLYGNESE